MGESTSQIERDIVAERNELGRNLQLLENKARSLADWRTYFRNHPFAMMGIALGGGVLLGALTKNFAVCVVGGARQAPVRRHMGSHRRCAPRRGVGKGDRIRWPEGTGIPRAVCLEASRPPRLFVGAQRLKK